MRDFSFSTRVMAESFRNRCIKIHLIVREGNRFAVVLPRNVNGREVVA